MDSSRKVYGIDLGTTYSCVAQVDQFDQAVVQKNFEGETTTPSAVYYEDATHIIVGSEAKEQAKMEPEKTVLFVKRAMCEDEAFNKPTKFPYNQDPVEISAQILRKIVKDANSLSGNPEHIKDVVITCPAYFGTKEKKRTQQAGILAGLNVLAIINEPTAAAIAYGVKADSEQTIMVYDLGGGTFDVTIIRVNGGAIRVVATGGDHHLGGADWDMCIAEYILSCYNHEHGTKFDLNTCDRKLYYKLMLEAEVKKKALSAKQKIRTTFEWEGKTSQVEITRELFDQLTEAKLDFTIDKANEVLEKAREQGFSRIDQVLLVGGFSRMPQVKNRVDKEFHCNAQLSDPDECVAKGAAIFALNKAYHDALDQYHAGDDVERPKPLPIGTRTSIIDVTSKTYGTDVTGNRVANLIFANQAVPCRATETFRTTSDKQRKVSMKIFESDLSDIEIEDRFAECVADKTLTLTKEYPEGTQIAVVFEVNSEGILSVHAEVNDDVIDFDLEVKGVRSAEELAKARLSIEKTVVE